MALPTGMICRASITVNGEKIYAVDYGLKAFCFYPSANKNGNDPLVQTKGTKKTAPAKQQS